MLFELGRYEPFGEKFIQKHPHILDSPASEESRPNQIIDLSSLSESGFKDMTPTRFHQLFSMSDISNLDIGDPLDKRKVNQQGKVENSSTALEQEVYVEGSTVVWSRAGYVLKSFNYSAEEKPIKQVLFAWFPMNAVSDPTNKPVIDTGLTNLEKDDMAGGYFDKSGNLIKIPSTTSVIGGNIVQNYMNELHRRTLVIVFEDRIKIHTEDGLNYSVDVPFEIGDVVPLDVGIMISKYYTPEVIRNRRIKDKKSTKVEESKMDHVLVTITRPFRGVCPVNLKDDKSNTIQASKLFTDPQIILYATIKSSKTGRLPVIVTLNIKENKHCIWTYDRVKPFPAGLSQPSSSSKRKMSSNKKRLNKRPKSNSGTDSPHVRFYDEEFSEEEDQHELENENSIWFELLDPSEITARLLWKESHSVKTSAKARGVQIKSKAFHIHDLNGEELICIMNYTFGNLVVIDLSKATQLLSHCIAFKYLAKDSIPIQATRDGCSDLLFMDAAGSPQLYITSDMPRYPIKLPQQTPIVQFKDSVHDRFTIVFDNGEMTRYRLNYRPHTSLVRDCLAAIDCAATHYFSKIWARFLKLSYFEPLDNEARFQPSEWQVFFVTLLSFLSLDKKGYYTGSKKSVSTASAIRDIQLQQIKASNTEYVLYELGLPIVKPVMNYEFLLDENYIQGVPHRWLDKIIEISKDEKNNIHMEPYEFTDIVKSLHIVFEDYRIKKTMRVHANLLGYLLLQSSVILGNIEWIDYYKDQGLNPLFTGNVKFKEQVVRTSFIEPPNIQVCLRQMTPNTSSNPTLLSSFGVNTLDTSLSHYRNNYALTIKHLWTLYGAINSGDKSLLLKRMVADRITRKDIEILVEPVSLPILEVLDELKLNPSMQWPKEAYIVIGRDDIYKQLQTKVKVCDPNTDTFKLPFLKDSDHPQSMHDLMEDYASTQVNKCVYDSDVLNMETERLRFGFGGFIEKVRIMLDATQIPELVMKEQPELSDEDLGAEHQAQTMLLVKRTLALATGRAIYAFGTHIPDLTKVLPIEPIVLSAKMLPLRTVIKMDDNIWSKEALIWPHFHNGVAAGLRISPSNNVNDSWIDFCNPTELEPQHGGMLLAMGLNGTLKKLPLVDWYRFMTQTCELVSIGFIMGAAASYRETKDIKVTKVLSVHIPALLPPQSASFNHSHLLQATCLLGMGLLYMNSCDRLMASTMLNEIGRNAYKDPSYLDPDYVGCALAAGFSLGFIILGAGDDASELANLHLRNKLYSLITGRSAVDTQRQRDKEHPTGHINLDATSPGATIALGLIYLKTENERVADSVGVLETSPYLNYVRPDFLLIRVVAKNLIMWSTILASDAWIDSQLPDFILANELPAHLDPEVFKQAKYNIIAGACLCMGLRYAGSKNEDAFRCLLNRLDSFIKLLNTSTITPQQHITKSAIRTCVDVCCSAAAMVMAGSGNRDLLGRLQLLHARVTEDMSYGNHMAVSMSLGLLFMGLGGYTLSTTNEAIAGLLCAFYPFYPTSTEDNRYHLQAFRHLWVLAVDSRWLMPFDVDNKKPCRVPMKLEIYEDDGSTTLHRKVKQVRIEAPSVVPDYKLIKSIQLDGDRYWPLWIDMVEGKYQESIIKSGLIYVKRKPGKKSYEEDPYGKRNIAWFD